MGFPNKIKDTFGLWSVSLIDFLETSTNPHRFLEKKYQREFDKIGCVKASCLVPFGDLN